MDEVGSREGGLGASDEAADPQEAVGAEHLHLEELIARMELALESGTADAELLRAARRLRDDMHAHLEREESLYYPTLWTLRPDLEPELRRLIAEHARLRLRLAELMDRVEGGDIRLASEELDRFVAHFTKHERAEEISLSIARGEARKTL